MRGEHSPLRMVVSKYSGSSPHARGTRRGRPPQSAPRGIIPACAGNTRPASGCWRTAGDHPRMRGEHCTMAKYGLPVRGSSPHARGTLPCRTQAGRIPGIIPACAGNTNSGKARAFSSRDHPRMRGEHVVSDVLDAFDLGSSPHARGTLVVLFLGDVSLGIIPACAGNTAFVMARKRLSRDHPRMRGEHPMRSVWLTSASGSSPHARGTPNRRTSDRVNMGIIPACAGNTRPGPASRLRCGDHPRMRGEHGLWAVNIDGIQGSSPHARGTLIQNRIGTSRIGIIPACAGNTPKHDTPSNRRRDHPRMRGEHIVSGEIIRDGLGSSPHARGTPPTYLWN